MNPRVTCFACQQKGHYANDPTCPMYGKHEGPALRDQPQVWAARVERSDTSSSGDETTTSLRDGSQYSSTTESDSPTSSDLGSNTLGSELDDESGSQEWLQVNMLSVETQDEDTRYICAIRVKVAPTVEERPA